MLAVHDSYAVSVAVASRLSSLGYSGEHFDAKAQQQYLRARFYDPANGRFNRLDPYAGNMQDPQSLHKYAYVHGDPIGGVDPSGKSLVGGIATAAIIGAAFGIVGNGLHNVSNNRSFSEGATNAAIFGGGLAVIGVLFPVLGVFLAGVGFGAALHNWGSIIFDGETTLKQKVAATALLVFSGFGLFMAGSYAAAAARSSPKTFWFNPRGFHKMSHAGMRSQLQKAHESIAKLWEIHNVILGLRSHITTAIGLFRKPDGTFTLRVMSNRGNGELAPGVRENLPPEIEAVTFDPAQIPAEHSSSTGNPHAEVRLWYWGKQAGEELVAVGASKAVCDSATGSGCDKFLLSRGVGLLGAVRARGNKPAFADPLFAMFGLRAAGTAGGPATATEAGEDQ